MRYIERDRENERDPDVVGLVLASKMTTKCAVILLLCQPGAGVGGAYIARPAVRDGYSLV